MRGLVTTNEQCALDFMSPFTTADEKRKSVQAHPYLNGNFAPIRQTWELTACSYTGTIPEELFGGEYVRNGGNPVANEDLGRETHWFDGDGMLSGVAFRRTENGVQPEFVNQFILTDVFLSATTSPNLRRPILPSISTLINPLGSLLTIIWATLRTIILVLLSRLPGSVQAIKKISVANTGVLFHDGRALATCESGPPMRVSLPGLETVGWYNGKKAEGEAFGEDGAGFGGDSLLGFIKEWTTAHPRVDPNSGELILFHSTFAPPYVHYSVITATHQPNEPLSPLERPTRMLNAPVPGITSAKMMHDFGVSLRHTVIMDLPLSLDPLNLIKNSPVISYDPCGRSRFGVFPRHHPDQVQWFETNASCIFHTANTWDDSFTDKVSGQLVTTAVNMLTCRMTSASIVFAAGDLVAPPSSRTTVVEEPECCNLYYHQFDLSSNTIKHNFSLADLPFEFPSTRDDLAMSKAKYIYGCSTSDGSFTAALGRTVKIDCLVKIDAESLIKRGKKNPPTRFGAGSVDMRSQSDILASLDHEDPIKIFKLPPKHFTQEPRFVSRRDGKGEDDGWLVTYVFDESQLAETGECKPDAKSELWIIDARDMKTIVARVHLPTRVPYGLHGVFVDEQKILNQRPVETIRSLHGCEGHEHTGIWHSIREAVEKFVG